MAVAGHSTQTFPRRHFHRLRSIYGYQPAINPLLESYNKDRSSELTLSLGVNAPYVLEYMLEITNLAVFFLA